MAKYIFNILGENPLLVISELKALFEIYHSNFKIIQKKKQYVIIESKANEDKIKKISESSAMLHFSAILKTKLNSLLLSDLEKIKWNSWVKPPFSVRVEKLYGAKDDNMESRLASPIWFGIKRPSVNLKAPKTAVLFIMDREDILVTKLLWKKESGRFTNREPTKKPAFHPTSLKPILARLLINLSRSDGNLLDPFCGVGSVLVEGSILGYRVLGSDLDHRMVKGAKTNLDFYKLGNYKLVTANALELEKHFKKNSINGIATDPPYGRSSHIGAKSLRELYKKFLESAHKVLKKGKHMALVYPNKIRVLSLLNKRKWKVIDQNYQYVHGGLTRKIIVLKKK